MYKEIVGATLHHAFYYDFDNETLVSEPIVAWAVASNQQVIGLVLEQTTGTLEPCDSYVNFIGVLNSTQLKSKETLEEMAKKGKKKTEPYNDLGSR
jgi:hypothetical protein